VHDAVPQHAARTGLHDRSTAQSADKGMRRARRQTEPPRDEVPGDRAEQRGEKHLVRDEVGVDQVLPDRLRDGDGDKRPREVRRSRDGNRRTRRQRARPDPCCDVVRGVVEAVREVEGERDGNYDDEQEHQRAA
jgi:hypothetical protein